MLRVWLLAFLLLFSTCVKAQEVIDPGIDKRIVYTDSKLTFSIASQEELLGENYQVIWDLGNGKQRQGKEIEYQYTQTGEYLVTVYLLTEEEIFTDRLILVVKEKNKDIDSPGSVTGFGGGGVIINELLPNPEGSDEENEWIELKNISNSSVDLTNWVVSDASGKRAKLTRDKYGNLLLPSGGFLVLPRPKTKISLNNDGDIVNLIDNKGIEVDSVQYKAKVPAGKSWSLALSGGWYWAEVPSPGSENIVNSPLTTSSSTNKDMIEIEMPKTINLKKIPDGEIEILDYETNIFSFDDIKINELFPNPKGDDRKGEFIELINLGDKEINISSFYLTDGVKKYYFPEGTIIYPKDFILVERVESKISLNNSGDKIILFSDLGEKVDELAYEKSYQDKSYSRSANGDFFWTDYVTPGEENEFSTTEDSDAKERLFVADIYDVLAQEKGAKVYFQGVITAEPGIFSNQFLYLQDSFAGLQVYMYRADWPDLKVGDIVEVSGIVSESYQEKRVNIKTSKDIRVISHGAEISPWVVKSSDDLLVGSLVKLSGRILEKSKNKWLLEFAEGKDTLQIFFKFNDDKLSDFKESDIIDVTGILRRRNEVLGIYPRSISDIYLVKSGQDLQVQKEEFGLVDKKDSVSKFILPYLAVFILIIILGVKIYLLKNRQILNIKQ